MKDSLSLAQLAEIIGILVGGLLQQFMEVIGQSFFLKKGFRGVLSGTSYGCGAVYIAQDQWLAGAILLVLGTGFIYWALLRPDKSLSCSFCGKRRNRANRIPGRVFICNDCLDRVHTVLAATHKTANTPIATIQYVSDDNREVRCSFCARHRYQVDAMAAAVRLGTSIKPGAGRAGREARICNRCLGRLESRREERARWLNERFATAADQLDSDKPAVRKAGVYAMAFLADNWEENRQTCVDVLCAYLRMPYEPDPGQHAPEPQRLAFHAIRKIRHTVIRVITEHLKRDAEVSWQGLNFDFTGVVFDGGDFIGAQFSGGTVRFDDAEFCGGTVRFDDAEFCGGTVRFNDARFSGGTVHFNGARFSGSTVHFGSAEFCGGTVHFGSAEFCGGTVHFDGARFCGGTIHFDGARFSGSMVHFDGAEFSGGTIRFYGAEFSGGTIRFYYTVFCGSTVDFDFAEFSGGEVDFGRARFSGGEVDFSGAGVWSCPPELPWTDTPPSGVKLCASPKSVAVDHRSVPK